MKRINKIFVTTIIFLVLTVITQIGGIVYLISLTISKYLKLNWKFKSTTFFFIFYLTATFIVIPLAAPFFGREKVRHNDKIKPANYITVLLNRNYIVPELNNL